MPIRLRRCPQCSSFFEPLKDYYRLCARCSAGPWTMDSNTSRRRRGGADRMHGGRSRLRGDTLFRSVMFRGDETRTRILAGFRDFATEYYHRPSGLSTIFEHAGFDDEWLVVAGEPRRLNGVLMSFCPLFRKWVHQYAGEKAMELVIEAYGLYGDERIPLDKLEYNLDLDDAARYKAWALGKLRQAEACAELERIARQAGNAVMLG